MATLLSLTSIGIGDLDIFLPSPPCLLVYTSYADLPESSVTYFWQDEKTGALHHELVYLEPRAGQSVLREGTGASAKRVDAFKRGRSPSLVQPRARRTTRSRGDQIPAYVTLTLPSRTARTPSILNSRWKTRV